MLTFFPHQLRSAISLSFFIRSFSYFASMKKISCVSVVYIFAYDGQRSRSHLAVIGKRFLPMGHFQLFSMILKFSMGHFLSFYLDFDGPFPRLMGLWRMVPCLPNHWFGWSVVLDKGTTCYKFWGHRLKVKVMRRQPRKISCTLFFLLYYNMYHEFLWNFSSPYASCPPVCNLWLGFVTLTMNSLIMFREMFHKDIWNFRIQIKI